MLSTKLFAAAVAAAVLSSTAVYAQKTTQLKVGSGGSPHVRSEWTIDGASLSVEYGRPYLKGRSEAMMMPPGQVWRVGADEVTTLKTDKPLKFGALTVPPGTYGIHAIPNATQWQLIISKQASGWGIPYPAGQDLGRASMSVGKTAARVEQLTISVADTPQGGALSIEWGTTRASVPFTIG